MYHQTSTTKLFYLDGLLNTQQPVSNLVLIYKNTLFTLGIKTTINPNNKSELAIIQRRLFIISINAGST